MPCLCHERAVTNVLFGRRHSDPLGEQLLFLTRILAITITNRYHSVSLHM